MEKEVYLFDNEEAIEVREADTDKELFRYSYRHNGLLIWNHKDSFRKIRALHLEPNLFKEVFKCDCGKILRIPDVFEARLSKSKLNEINYDLKCDCGKVRTVECDTLRVKNEEE